MDYQDNKTRSSYAAQRKPLDVNSPNHMSRQQRVTVTTGADGSANRNQDLRWEKVPVIHTGNSVRVVSTGQINGPLSEGNLAQANASDYWLQNQNTFFQEPNHLQQQLQQQQQQLQQQQQAYFQQSQNNVQQQQQPPKVVRVPMLIEVAPRHGSEKAATLPMVDARVSHNFEVVHAGLVHPGHPLGSYTSHTFTVDESELEDFDPFKKQESILSSLNLDAGRPRKGFTSPSDDPIIFKETSFGPENDLNNNDDDDDDAEIIIDSAPITDQSRSIPHRPQHPLTSSKSSAGDSKSGHLFRKPSIRRKSNPLAAFLTGGSKEVKKSGKGKNQNTGGLPSGFRIRERGSSLTRFPADSKSRLDQVGNPQPPRNADPLSDAWTDYIENTYEKYDVVLRKEEEGYGIQLHGQYPVVVDNVRPGGGAAKNGIVKGDIIFKINGNLVVKQSHDMVINCFKNAGPFMGLTLLRAPQTGLEEESKGSNLTSLFAQDDKISNPTPAARDKNLELGKERLSTLKSMYLKAVGELEQLKNEVQKNPDDMMMMKYERHFRLVTQLKEQISIIELASGQSGHTIIDQKGGQLHAELPRLAMPVNLGFGQSLFGNQSQATEIMSMEGLDNPEDGENEDIHQHQEFEDLNLLRQSPAHLACFLKYLIQSSCPNYMLFHIVATCYSQSCLKETSQSLKWAYEIYLAFLLESSPLPLRLHPNVVKFVESCLGSGKDTKSIFQPAISSVQDVIVRQLEEFQHQRTLGLGNFFGEEFLPKTSKLSNLSTSSSFTAPVSYQTSQRPPLSNSNVNLNSFSPSVTNVNSARGPGNLSSNSFSYPKCSSGVGAGAPCDPHALEKILWDVFESCLAVEEGDVWKTEQVKPAIAAALATFFRHQGATLTKPNQVILDSVASFVWRDKKAVKSKLKMHVPVNGHDFAPNIFLVLSVVECSLCSKVLWGAGHQGYKCHHCEMVLHKNCTKLPSVPPCSKVPLKQKIESTATFYTGDPNNFYSLPSRKKRPPEDGFSDSEYNPTSELDPITSPTGVTSPLVGSGSGPSLTSLSTYDINDSDMEVENDLPPLAKVIPEEELSRLVGAARKKQEIINELFFTERSHVKSLLITVHCYLVPMRKDPKIDQQLVDLLFPNLESIAQWHKELSREFKARRREQNVVHEVGDILMRKFSGPSGLKLQEDCAEFCKNQLVNLELLKNRRRQDAYLNHFIMNTTQKDICKKQDLKDRLPKVMQRLTKYPLLFDNLLKITPVGTEEHACLLRALKNVKMILDHINETVRESENHRVLLDMQRRMDARPLENVHHPILDEFRNLQLTDHKLRHYGHLTWNTSASKKIELYLALFNDLLVIFQNQDNRLVLKCETAGQDLAKFVFVPILKLGNLLVKRADRTTRTFYLINASKEASQMYTLNAKTKEEREAWMKQIRETTDDYKRKHSQPHLPVERVNKPSVLTETSPCYELVEQEVADLSRNHGGEGETADDKEEVDVTDGAKEEVDDDELLNNDQSHAVYNPEKELKRQIIATYELMIDKVKALSELHHIESPNIDLSEKTLPLDTDSEVFVSTLDGVIDDMTSFFNNLPDVVMFSSGQGDGPQEWDPVESLLELGQRLEMLVRQLEILVLQRNLDVPPPVPTSDPPPLEEDPPPNYQPKYVESNF